MPLIAPASTRIIHIQTQMAERALELLVLPADDVPKLILDLGCGSALAGHVIESRGHVWIGSDISPSMLEIARQRADEVASEGSDPMSMGETSEASMGETDESAEEDGGLYQRPLVNDVLLQDMGEGVSFRPGTFDGCISISALQWLCHSNKSSENPRSRLARLFSTLFAALRRGARAVFQFYPESPEQVDLILGAATKAGFTGGLVVDYPHSSRAKKYYLCLLTGVTAALPQALEGEGAADEDVDGHVPVARRQMAEWRDRLRERKRREKSKDKAWVLQKKELYRKRGREVAEDSKYTARKRRPRF